MSGIEERRRFFRLDDQVTLDFKPLSEEKYKSWQEQNKNNKNNRNILDKEIGDLMHKVKSKNPDLARLLELLNQKINHLGTQCTVHGEIAPPSVSNQEGLTRINLSACGMSFQSAHSYKTGEYLLLSMLLKPANTPMSLAGQVIGVEQIPNSDKPFKIRINFPDIQETEQELLIQHLFQLQTKHLKREQELNQ